MPSAFRTPPVEVLRAQVSHTWLDHEILLLSAAEAVRRWRDGNWGRLRREFLAHRQRAAVLLERLEEYSGHLVFDSPEAAGEMPAGLRERLRERTLERWRAATAYPALRDAYAGALDDLCSALDRFESIVFAADATEEAVARAWLAVREHAGALKELFSSDRVPREVSRPWI